MFTPDNAIIKKTLEFISTNPHSVYYEMRGEGNTFQWIIVNSFLTKHESFGGLSLSLSNALDTLQFMLDNGYILHINVSGLTIKTYEITEKGKAVLAGQDKAESTETPKPTKRLPKFSDCAEITEINTILDYAATNYRMLYANTPKRVGNTQHGESVHVFPDGSQITIKTKGNGNYFIRRLYVGDILVIEAKYKANSSVRY